MEVDGLINLDDFEDETGIELPEGPYETVAGFIMAQLGRLPVPGDRVDYEGHRIVVRDVENRRVGRVLVTAVPPEVVLDADLTVDPATVEVADEADPSRQASPADSA